MIFRCSKQKAKDYLKRKFGEDAEHIKATEDSLCFKKTIGGQTFFYNWRDGKFAFGSDYDFVNDGGKDPLTVCLTRKILATYTKDFIDTFEQKTGH